MKTLTQAPLTAFKQQDELVDDAEPGQPAPPHEGAGLVQLRDMGRVTLPQLLDQEP